MISGVTGTGDTIIIHLDNNYPPVVNFDEHPQEINGEASFQFEVLKLEQSDFLSFSGFYSTDDGLAWVLIPDSSITTFVVDGQGTTVWNTYPMFSDIDQNQILFKLTPYDADEGQSGISSQLNIDNLSRAFG